LSDLRFGEFTGDGITDVLAVVSGRWQISGGARSAWEPLNALSDSVPNLFIGNVDGVGSGDIITYDEAIPTSAGTPRRVAHLARGAQSVASARRHVRRGDLRWTIQRYTHPRSAAYRSQHPGRHAAAEASYVAGNAGSHRALLVLAASGYGPAVLNEQRA
jgi:hypothetical protein